MNEQIYLTNFPVLDKEELLYFANELGLSMTDELLLCRDYFSAEAKRIPMKDELILLNRLVTEAKNNMAYQTVTELFTDEKYIAKTYGDMMARRRSLTPRAPLPPSFVELSTLAKRYLENTKKNPPPKPVVALGKDRHHLPVVEKSMVAFDDTEISIGKKDPSPSICREEMEDGDTVYAAFESVDRDGNFEERLNTFLASFEVTSASKRTLPVYHQSPLLRLLSLEVGIQFRSFLLADGRDLLEPQYGAIFVANANGAASLLMEGHERGIRIQRLGKLTKNGALALPLGEGLEKSFSLSFLRSLIHTRHSVTLDKGAPEDTLLRTFPSSTFSMNEETYSVTKVTAQGSSPFHAALYAAIGGMTAAMAKGASPDKLFFATSVAAPADTGDPATLGGSLSALLGLYRAECEFSLHNCATEFDQAEDAPTVSLWTIAPAESLIPDTVVGGGTSIFYLEPKYGKDGLPDFEDFRKLHTYLHKLHQDGIVLSARAATGDLLITLGKMSVNTEVEYVRNDRIVARLGGILVESNSSLEGVLVARTEKAAPTTSEA